MSRSRGGGACVPWCTGLKRLTLGPQDTEFEIQMSRQWVFTVKIQSVSVWKWHHRQLKNHRYYCSTWRIRYHYCTYYTPILIFLGISHQRSRQWTPSLSESRVQVLPVTGTQTRLHGFCLDLFDRWRSVYSRVSLKEASTSSPPPSWWRSLIYLLCFQFGFVCQN